MRMNKTDFCIHDVCCTFLCVRGIKFNRPFHEDVICQHHQHCLPWGGTKQQPVASSAILASVSSVVLIYIKVCSFHTGKSVSRQLTNASFIHYTFCYGGGGTFIRAVFTVACYHACTYCSVPISTVLCGPKSHITTQKIKNKKACDTLRSLPNFSGQRSEILHCWCQQSRRVHLMVKQV